MTGSEFQKKWEKIRIGHDPSCPRDGGFDFEICTCGHDEEWERRNADLATVPEADLEELRKVKR